MDTLTALTDFFKRDTDDNTSQYEAVAEACCQRKGDLAFFPIQWLRERLEERGGDLSGANYFSVRLVEALGNVIELEAGGIRSGPGVPPPVQRRMATQVRTRDKPLSAVLLRRDPEGGWLRHLSPRRRGEGGQKKEEQLQALKFLLQNSRKKAVELQRCGSLASASHWLRIMALRPMMYRLAGAWSGWNRRRRRRQRSSARCRRATSCWSWILRRDASERLRYRWP